MSVVNFALFCFHFRVRLHISALERTRVLALAADREVAHVVLVVHRPSTARVALVRAVARHHTLHLALVAARVNNQHLQDDVLAPNAT